MIPAATMGDDTDPPRPPSTSDNTDPPKQVLTLDARIQALAQELKDLIITFLPETTTASTIAITKTTEPPLALGLNRKLRAETIPLYYATNTFHFGSHGFFGNLKCARKWLSLLPPEHRALIKRILLDEVTGSSFGGVGKGSSREQKQLEHQYGLSDEIIRVVQVKDTPFSSRGQTQAGEGIAGETDYQDDQGSVWANGE